MTAPKVIWAYSASSLSFDEGEWDQAEIPQCGPDWPHARYIRADAPELLALVDAVKKTRYSWINESQFGLLPVYHRMSAQLLRDDAAKALSAYEALQ